MEGVLGTIMAVGLNFAPRSWAFCEGQLLAISQNTALFSLLGTNFGGDGRTTFGLPDLRGRSIVGAGRGAGLSNINLGERSGRELISFTPSANYSFTITEAQMPVHTHTATLHAEDGPADRPGPLDRMLARASSGTQIYRDAIPAENKSMHSDSIVVDPSGGGQAVSGIATGHAITENIRNPYLGLHYVICVQGIFPSRN